MKVLHHKLKDKTLSTMSARPQFWKALDEVVQGWKVETGHYITLHYVMAVFDAAAQTAALTPILEVFNRPKLIGPVEGCASFDR